MAGKKRAIRGIARLESVKGRLRIRFPSALCGGNPLSRSLGMEDTLDNRKAAQLKIDEINNDIIWNKFDPTLEKYLPQSKQKEYQQQISKIYPEKTLLSLWIECTEYSKPSVKETTWLYWKTTIEPWICKLPYNSADRALEIRQWLLDNTTESMTKRVIGQLSKVFRWGLKHKKVTGQNPFDGMAAELKHQYEREPDPNPFTKEEKEAILNVFRNHQGNWNGRNFTGAKLSFYAPFVEFLFCTGCRPEEAVGLTWKDVPNHYRYIVFDGGIVYSSGKKISTKGQGSKNNRRRHFPCNDNLKAFLRSLPKPSQTNALVFPAPKGGAMNYNNFRDRIWKKLVNPIKPNTTPYDARDTFITEQVREGIPIAIVAQWTDNSTATIEKYYLGDSPDILPK